MVFDSAVCINCKTKCNCNTWYYNNRCTDDCFINNTRFCEDCKFDIPTLHLDDDKLKVYIYDLAIDIEDQKKINKELSDKNIIYSQQIKYLIKNTSKLIDQTSELIEQNKILTNRVKALESVYNFRPNPNAKPFVPSVPSGNI